MSNTKVGCIIANHNYGRWVGDAANSLVNDPYPHKALMIVDDGSTDNSWEVICEFLNVASNKQEEVVRGYLGHCPTFAYRFPKAGGPARARNKAIHTLWEHVDAFQFLDADDFIKTGKLSKGVRKLEENPMVGAVYSDYDTFNPVTGLYCREYKEPFSRERLRYECIVNNNSLVTKKAFETVGLYDEEMRTCEDYDLWMRISERFLITHIPEPLVVLRVGSHSSTATVNKETWTANWQRVMQKAQLRAMNGQK